MSRLKAKEGQMKVQSFKHLIDEMKTVAKGEAAALPGAALPSVESADVLVRLLTTDNRPCCC